MSHVKLVYDSHKGVMVPKGGSGSRDATPRRKTQRICYVDDSRTSVYVTSKMLRQYGYDIDQFSSGETALDAILENDYDLLLTDLIMSGSGGINGDDLIRIVRNCGHPSKVNIPIVVVTGNNDAKTVDALYGAGADEVMIKPVKGRELDAVIKNLIAARGDDGEARMPHPAKQPPAASPQVGRRAESNSSPTERSLPTVRLSRATESIPILEDVAISREQEPDFAVATVRAREWLDEAATADTDETAADTPKPAEPTAEQTPADELYNDHIDDSDFDDIYGEPLDLTESDQDPVYAEPYEQASSPEPYAREAVNEPQEPQVVVEPVTKKRGGTPNRSYEVDAEPVVFQPQWIESSPKAVPEENNPLLALLDDLDLEKKGAKGARKAGRNVVHNRGVITAGRIGGLLSVLLLGAAGVFWGFEEKIPEVRIATVDQGAIYESITVPGKVVSKRKVELSAYYPGLLESVEVKEGDKVTKGQLLAHLDDREARSRVKRAEANLLSVQEEVSLASKTQERMLRALDMGAVSRKMVEDAEGEWKAASARESVAEEELAAARLLLERAKVTAPFDGTITALNAHVGQWTAPPEPLMILVDATQQEVEVKVDAADSARLRIDQNVSLSSEAFPGKAWNEKITRVAPATNRDTSANTIDVLVSLGAKAPPLRMGQQVDAEIRTRANLHALKLPFDALLNHDGETTVAVINNGRVHFVPVITGIEDFTHVEIVKGLFGGQQVILRGGKDLQEGQKVRVNSAG